MMLCEQRCYLIFSDDENEAFQAGSVHAVDIFALADAADVSLAHTWEPRDMSPAPGREADYSLLREALGRSGKIALACVVVQCRPQLAVLAPAGSALVLKILQREEAAPPLRYAARSAQEHSAAVLSDREIALTRSLIDLIAASAASGRGASEMHSCTEPAPAAEAPCRAGHLAHIPLPPISEESWSSSDTLGVMLGGSDPHAARRRGSCQRPGASLRRPQGLPSSPVAGPPRARSRGKPTL